MFATCLDRDRALTSETNERDAANVEACFSYILPPLDGLV